MTTQPFSCTTVQAGFARRAVFTALRAHNVMGHKDVYKQVGHIINSRRKPYRILDIGCGDGSDIQPLLRHSLPVEYVGVDSSAEAIAEANRNLAELPCRVRLLHGDYQDALTGQPKFDIIWMGLFLHHLSTYQKKEFLRQAQNQLTIDGLLLAHDPLLANNEDRKTFIARLERHGRENWPFLNADDLRVACRHWADHGHQESFSTLFALGRDAGFTHISTLWSDPDRFYGLLCFERN